MKKILLLIFSIIACTANAQQPGASQLNLADRRSALFDFSAPLTLSPSVTPAPDGGYVDVNAYTFKKDSITLEFHKTSSTPGATVGTFYSSLYNKFDYWLEVNHNTQLDFNCINGYIDRIEFLDDVSFSGIAVEDGQSGAIIQAEKAWQSDKEQITSRVLLQNKSVAYAKLYRIQIFYYLPKAQYVPAVNLSQEEPHNTISSLNLTFAENISFVNNPDFKILYNEEELGKSVATDGKVVTISLEHPVSDDGVLTITIPEGCFVTEKGYCNKALEYKYNIVRKRDTFVPVSITPDVDMPINALSSGDIVLDFEDAISGLDEELRFELFKEGRERPVCLLKPVKVSEDNTHSVKLEFDQAVSNTIEQHGVYTVVIPEKSFYSFKGNKYEAWNPTFKLTYNIGGKECLVPAISPEDGAEVEKFYGLELRFENDITYDESETITLTFNDEAVDFTVSTQGSVASIKLAKRIAEEGEIKIHIPSFCFAYADGQVNKMLDYTFTVKPVVSEAMKEALSLLEKTGVGYPKETSASYVALKTLVDTEDVADVDLVAATAGIYNESDVLLPANNEYFMIACLNSNGDSLFVAYEDKKISISDNIAQAAIFGTSVEDGKVVFRTMDGKYLHVLTGLDDYQPTTSSACLTDEKTEASKLTMAKLAIAGKEKETFGLLTMFGLLGADELDGSKSTYAVVNCETKSLVKGIAATPRFDEKFSSGFGLIKTEKPDLFIGLKPSVVCAEVDKGYSLIVTFTAEDNVSIHKTPAEVIVKEKGADKGKDKADTLQITPSEIAGKFSVNLGTKNAGNYTLTIPEKTFVSIADGEERFLKEIVADFTIKDITDPSFGFVQQLQGFVYLYNSFYIEEYPCEKLNDYVVFIEKGVKQRNEKLECLYNDTLMIPVNIKDIVETEVTLDDESVVLRKDTIWNYSIEDCYNPKELVGSNKIVNLRRLGYGSEVVRKGRFVPYADVPDNMLALRIEFDEGPIEKDELENGTYRFEIEAATYGDANFGKYLADPKSIPASQCNVNPYLTLTVEINNEASAVAKPEAVKPTQANGIYDLSGRKVETMSRPGIYIINGKKVVKR